MTWKQVQMDKQCVLAEVLQMLGSKLWDDYKSKEIINGNIHQAVENMQRTHTLS